MLAVTSGSRTPTTTDPPSGRRRDHPVGSDRERWDACPWSDTGFGRRACRCAERHGVVGPGDAGEWPGTRRGPPGGGPLARLPIVSRSRRASQLGRVTTYCSEEKVTARWWSWTHGAAGGKPLASCRNALGKAPRRDGPSAKARGADGGEDGPPRGRRRGRAAAARQRAWRRRRPGRRRAGRTRAGSAWPAGDLRWGRTCVRKAKRVVGRNRLEHVFALRFA
jgi:hypothetical protein